jgi:hypothetical protein
MMCARHLSGVTDCEIQGAAPSAGKSRESRGERDREKENTILFYVKEEGGKLKPPLSKHHKCDAAHSCHSSSQRNHGQTA